ncbi:hypothetical protein KC573_00780, partial [candidate division WWE3 bacterium]|nr:hypothetical protein [candidate division WWE3 bacterium]
INAELIIEAGPFRWAFRPDEPMSLSAKGTMIFNFLDEPRRQENIVRDHVVFGNWPIIAAEMLKELTKDPDFERIFWNEHGNPKAQNVLNALSWNQAMAEKVQTDDFLPLKPQKDETFARWPSVAIEGPIDQFSFELFRKGETFVRELKNALPSIKARIAVIVNAEYNSMSASINYGLAYLFINWQWGRYATGYVVLCDCGDNKPQLSRNRINVATYDNIIQTCVELLAEDGKYLINNTIIEVQRFIEVVKAARNNVSKSN